MATGTILTLAPTVPPSTTGRTSQDLVQLMFLPSRTLFPLQPLRQNPRHSTLSTGARSPPCSTHGSRRFRFESAAMAKAAAAATAQEKKVLLPIANGSEEMEVVIVADILRRAGADVTLASVGEDVQIVASRKVKLVADTLISGCETRKYDLIVLPGGMPGAENLRNSEALEKLAQTQMQEKRLCAAICAAPAVAFQSWGILNGLEATCYPTFQERLSTPPMDARVVRDGLVTTSQGPGTAFDFSLCLVEQLFGREKRLEVTTPLVLNSNGAFKSSAMEYNFEDWKLSKGPCNVLVPVANGSEEMEIVIIVDVLRRAGFKVVMASVEKELQILASRNVKIVADKYLKDVSVTDFDIILLPGGIPGAERLRDSEKLTNLLSNQLEAKKPVGAICAAPAVVLEAKGLLKGKKATSHPAFSSKLSDQSAVDERVVIDGSTITSRGPGTAMEFALSIVEKVLGRSQARSIAEAMIFPYH